MHDPGPDLRPGHGAGERTGHGSGTDDVMTGARAVTEPERSWDRQDRGVQGERTALRNGLTPSGDMHAG